MRPVRPGFLLPSACFTIHPRLIRSVGACGGAPLPGDVILGRVVSVGEHSHLENTQGRLHAIHDGSRAVFVFGHRYAPDYYEGVVPDRAEGVVDMLARSGIVGRVRVKNDQIKAPTRTEVLGRIHDGDGRPLSTLDHPLVRLRREHDPRRKRARMILSIGTSMNSGKSTTAAAACWALNTMGYTVRGAKVTGTASLKDILHMQDAGAEKVADFTHLGHPSTYLLPEERVREIFRILDFKYANNPRNYWVVEIAFEDLAEVVERAFAESPPDPEESAGRIAALRRCVGSLPERARQIVDARYRDRLDLAGVARRVGWNPNAVKVALAKARRATLRTRPVWPGGRPTPMRLLGLAAALVLCFGLGR